jgi:hypothetical protein
MVGEKKRRSTRRLKGPGLGFIIQPHGLMVDDLSGNLEEQLASSCKSASIHTHTESITPGDLRQKGHYRLFTCSLLSLCPNLAVARVLSTCPFPAFPSSVIPSYESSKFILQQRGCLKSILQVFSVLSTATEATPAVGEVNGIN